MKHESKRRGVLGSVWIVLVAALLASVAAAQQPPKKPADPPPASESQQEAKKLRGRLPAYYGKVVSEKQRTEIYKIQAKYNEQIEKLKKELDSLTDKRNTEVEEVLTDEQRAEVAKMKAARRSSSKASTDKPAEADGQ
jgi:Spy/CpxP family protein refolding chaperone